MSHQNQNQVPVPGSNPNTQNASRRQSRSGRTNTPRPLPPRSDFIDPLPEPITFESQISDKLIPGQQVVGTIKLDPSQIDLCADMVSDVTQSVRNHLDSRIAFPNVKNITKSVYHMCAAGQMYSTMKLLSENQGDIYRFKSLLHLNIEVPKFINSLTQNYGHFESKEGIVKVDHLQTLMIREISKGLSLARNDIPRITSKLSLQNCNRYYADSNDFTDVLNSKCQALFNSQELEEFDVNVGLVTLRTRLPKFDPNSTAKYVAAVEGLITSDISLVSDLKIAVKSYNLTFSEFKNQVTADEAERLGLIELPITLPELNKNVGTFSSNYALTYHSIFSQLFETSQLSFTEAGASSQLLNHRDETGTSSSNIPGEETCGFHPYALSERSSAIGFILMPCKEVNYSPEFYTYSEKNRRRLLNDFAMASAV